MSDGLKQRVVTALILLVALIALTLLTTPLTFAAVSRLSSCWRPGSGRFARLGGVPPGCSTP